MKKITSVVLALLLALSMMSGFAAAESKLWTEEDMPDGWTKIVNEGGATLGYSKDSRSSRPTATLSRTSMATANLTSMKTGATITKSARRLWPNPEN